MGVECEFCVWKQDVGGRMKERPIIFSGEEVRATLTVDSSADFAIGNTITYRTRQNWLGKIKCWFRFHAPAPIAKVSMLNHEDNLITIEATNKKFCTRCGKWLR